MELLSGLAEDFVTWSLVFMVAAVALLFLTPLITTVMQGLAVLFGLLYAIPYGLFRLLKRLFGGSRR